MRTSDVLSHYDNNQSAVARALGITRAAIGSWGELVPPWRAMALHKLTHGKLRFDPDAYANWNKPKSKSAERRSEHT